MAALVLLHGWLYEMEVCRPPGTETRIDPVPDDLGVRDDLVGEPEERDVGEFLEQRGDHRRDVDVLVGIHAEDDSSVALVLWSGWAGWGMLGTVVWLLTGRERIGHRRAAQVVRTVKVPCLRQGPYRDTPAGPAAARTAPGQWPTDQAQGTTASRNAGQTTTRDGTRLSSQP